jgi:hypothetical protein
MLSLANLVLPSPKHEPLNKFLLFALLRKLVLALGAYSDSGDESPFPNSLPSLCATSLI